ncbi:beta-N-acetylhexosaminidase [Gemmatirosa kalamazoonensis]|nr:family 20 glycosylhydrolase [Gemmatirosa kalamazoonensis]
MAVWTNWGVTPWIFNADDRTIAFMQDVLTEVLGIFPSTFIHVGGDEAAKDVWKTDPGIQARIKQLGLKDEHELQSWFIKQMDGFLTAKGRRLIGWDEILEGGLAPGATVMSWRGMNGGIAAAQAGHDVVMAPTTYTYFDYYQTPNGPNRALEPLSIGGYLPIDTVYAFEPVPPVLDSVQAKHILGGQAQLWTEYIPTPKQAEYMAFPRLVALAEVLWTPRERKDFADFQQRLTRHFARLDALDVNYRRGP